MCQNSTSPCCVCSGDAASSLGKCEGGAERMPRAGLGGNISQRPGSSGRAAASHRELFELCWGESGPQHLRLCLQNPPGSECATVRGAKTQRLCFMIPCTDLWAQPAGIPESSPGVIPLNWALLRQPESCSQFWAPCDNTVRGWSVFGEGN